MFRNTISPFPDKTPLHSHGNTPKRLWMTIYELNILDGLLCIPVYICAVYCVGVDTSVFWRIGNVVDTNVVYSIDPLIVSNYVRLWACCAFLLESIMLKVSQARVHPFKHYIGLAPESTVYRENIRYFRHTQKRLKIWRSPNDTR